MEVVYLSSAQKQIRKLSLKAQSSIVEAVHSYATNTKSVHDVKNLQGMFADKKRLRVGIYRIIFSLENDNQIIVMIISKVGHRKNIYKK